MENIFQSFLTALSVWIPIIFGALVILLVGWIIAKILAFLTSKLLSWIKLDERLAKGLEDSGEKPSSVEKQITNVVYYLVLFMAVLAALNALGMTAITALFAGMFAAIFEYLPRVLSAIVLALIAWFVARILRAIVSRALARLGADKKVTEQAGMAPAPISGSIGEAVYWLVWLLFLPMILGVLGLTWYPGAHQCHADQLAGNSAGAVCGSSYPYCWPVRCPHFAAGCCGSAACLWGGCAE